MVWTDSVLTGFFTGFGVITAQYVFEKYVKPTLTKAHEMKPKVNLRNILDGEIEITTGGKNGRTNRNDGRTDKEN